jgi:glycosyltransferase involved in cell wall biosynthesis
LDAECWRTGEKKVTVLEHGDTKQTTKEQMAPPALTASKLSENKHAGITVIIPTLNEEKSIADLIRELYGGGFSNILVIDGNSTDCTAEVAMELGVNVIYQNGKGKGDALRQAFSYKELSDWVVMIDADGSMNPHEILSFLEHLGNGTDVVKGSRFLPEGFSKDMTLFRKIGNKFFLFLVNLLWNANYTDLCYGYAAFKKDSLDKIYPLLKSKNFEIETEIFIKAKKLGLRVKEVPSGELRRRFGKSNLDGFGDGFKILKTIVHEALHS